MDILIVEDNPMILKSLNYTLSQGENRVQCAIDGLQGREFFNMYKPNLVIADLLLPFVTGLELIEYIRTSEESYTKIMVLSSLGVEDTICQAFDLGVDDYMTKPFMSTELLARINRLVKYDVHLS